MSHRLVNRGLTVDNIPYESDFTPKRRGKIMAPSSKPNPSWYTPDDESAWEKVKAAFQRDWQQTLHDFGGKEPDIKQQASDTIAQAAGVTSIPPTDAPTTHAGDGSAEAYNEADESAYRYGYAASRQFDGQTEWNEEIELELKTDWADDADWLVRRAAIRRGWYYGKLSRRPSVEQ